MSRARDVADDDRREEQNADDDVLGVAGDVRELHAVAQLGNEDESEEDSENRAGASEDVDTSEHDRGHDVEQRAPARICSGRPEVARRRRRPRIPAMKPEMREDGYAYARYRDPGEAGRLAVRADRVEVAAEPSGMEDESQSTSANPSSTSRAIGQLVST